MQNIKNIKQEIDRKEQRIKKDVRESEESIGKYLKRMFTIKEDVATNDEIKERIVSGGKITGTNMVVMVCAIVIASVGLNTDSIAVIIGAMLISPLMGSILSIAYGTASNNSYMVRKHLSGFAIQIFISVLSASVYFLLSPNKEMTSQLLARTEPKFYDVLIAIAGGVAGIVGQTRQDKGNNIVTGVAIATALMPPLCTCGYGIATMNVHVAGRAFYLFVINAYFIYATASAVLAILGTPKLKELTETEWKIKRKKMFRNVILILIPIAIEMVYNITDVFYK